MSNHYYSEKPTTESSRRNWSFNLRGMTLSFTSDTGVFSKKEVDFGTRLLLETVELDGSEKTMLDVGCGYGPIGLTLAKENKNSHVYLVDTNERAIELSILNAQINDIDNVTVKKSDLLSNVNGVKFDIVLSNPPIRAGKKVVHQLFEEAFEHLEHDGVLWIVIQKKQGAPSAIEKLQELFGEVDVVKKSKGYYIIKSKKC